MPDIATTVGSDLLQLPPRVMVVEDEHLVAMDLAHSLEQMGCGVIGPAGNGQQALDLAKIESPDLAIVDIKMPVMQGTDAAGVLHRQMGVPVVVVSAYSDSEYLQAATRIGIYGYLIKPVTTEMLRATVGIAWGRYVEHQKLRDQVQELKTTLENRKIIEAAKGLVMQKLGLTEDQAMKRLQKQARDSRRKMVDLARAILDTDALLG